MPSKVDQARATPTLLAIAQRENAAVLVKSLTIDNLNGGGDRIIEIDDIFTPSDSSEGTSLSQKTIERFKYTALQGDQITLGEVELKGVRCLGAMQVISNADDPSCFITVGYEHEE